jgi:hypothetical protein
MTSVNSLLRRVVSAVVKSRQVATDIDSRDTSQVQIVGTSAKLFQKSRNGHLSIRC